jgi:SEFIR domain/NACHT domain
MARVFISYRQTDETQRKLVRALGQRLLDAGIEVDLDQFFLDTHPGGPNEGWDKWSSDRALHSERVLIVGTPAWFQCFDKSQPPGTGLGAACEADDLRHRIYDAGGVIESIRVVLFDDADAVHIPGKLKRYHHFHADRDFESFVRWIDGTAPRHASRAAIEHTRDREESDAPADASELSGSHTSAALVRYRKAVKAKYDQLVSGRNLAAITARTESDLVVEARPQITEWITARQRSDLVVLGDPGSGKTYLLRELCAQLSERHDLLPVFVPAAQLEATEPTTWSGLLDLADPPVSPAICGSENLVVVIDGLDELIGPRRHDQADYAEKLQRVGRLIPSDARVVYSCRSTTFEATSSAVIEALHSRGPRLKMADDATDEAIRVALRERSDSLVHRLKLLELSEQQALAYLRYYGSTKGEDNPIIEYVLRHLPRVPVIVRFLELALPELHGADGRVELDELYTAAMRSLILRDPVFGKQNIDMVWKLLVRFASGRPLTDEQAGPLVHAGLLSETPRGGYAWSHVSIRDFFLSLSLLDELTRFDASTLARLDLIGAYNINRFLLPRCRRTLSRMDEPDNIRPVRSDEYRRFLAATGWRRKTQYGTRPGYVAKDGTGFTSGVENLAPEADAWPESQTDQEHVCGLSWYDAFVYCLWSRQRLPRAVEIGEYVRLPRESWVWCADWTEESKAHVAVVTFDKSGRAVKGGINPDFRHSRIGLVTARREGPNDHLG